MHRLIHALPEDLRVPLALSSAEGLTSIEIGLMPAISEGTVRTRIAWAKRILRGKIEERYSGLHSRATPVFLSGLSCRSSLRHRYKFNHSHFSQLLARKLTNEDVANTRANVTQHPIASRSRFIRPRPEREPLTLRHFAAATWRNTSPSAPPVLHGGHAPPHGRVPKRRLRRRAARSRAGGRSRS